MNSIVIGAGFGDEGNGTMVNYLCKQSNKPLVVRFNGGQQMGHTVVENDVRHIFSNFGSGTLVGAPTYISEFCTVDPVATRNELKSLTDINITPEVFYNANAMIVTPYDILCNIKDVDNKLHGTVGVGFGTTIERNENNYKLYARDLLYPQIRNEKLRLIKEYYRYIIKSFIGDLNIDNIMLDNFINSCDLLVERFKIVDGLRNIYGTTMDLIFEGSQGIMLDMDYGFFPHVTRSNTTSKNAISILNSLRTVPNFFNCNTYYMTRAYQTRHGNGFMTNEGYDMTYITDNPNETNINNKYQGNFRKSPLDVNLLNYAISCDNQYNSSNKNIVVTCLDQVSDVFPINVNNEIILGNCETIENEIKIKVNILKSYSERGI